MPSEKRLLKTPGWRYGLIALGWLIIISLLQYHFDYRHEERRVVKMGYMPVIANLAAPLIDRASEDAGDFRFLAIKFSSFAEMAEALRNHHIDVAFIIAPLAIVLRQGGEDVKIVYIGNRHESTLVVRKGLHISKIDDLSGRTLAVPMRYSGHYLEALRLQEEHSLKPAINIVEMNPPDMASALACGSLDAYFVGEPFAAQTILSGDADVLCYSEDLSPDFICNLLLVQQDLIDHNAKLLQQLVSAAARSGVWADAHPAAAARIASLYWSQAADVIEFALTTPQSRIEYDRFIPEPAEIKKMAEMMVRFKLLENSEINGLVNRHFARSVDLEGVSGFKSIIQ